MNLPSGESLVRQLVYGQRNFESQFGVRCREAWLPDVFGSPASLPQIFRAGGCDRLITQKLSWNKNNQFPHSTFEWQGLDGSKVLTHFPPVDTNNATVGAPVPVWNGELYFETHRGTLTSQARTKVGNRLCERLLREAELWWATATATSMATATAAIPTEVADELEELWKQVLVQQFHDILPGSSITWVHDDAEATHTRVAARLEELIAQALAQLAPSVPAIANASAHARHEVVGSGRTAFIASVPGFGIAPLTTHEIDDHVAVTEHSFTNKSIAVSWDLDGTITSIIDVRFGRELLPQGATVTLQLAPDHPIEYDAWDVESWTRSRGSPIGGVESCEIVDAGPLVATLRVRRKFGRSTIEQKLTVRAGSACVDLKFEIDWHEEEKLLSLLLPLDVHAREAACDIQFGHVMRPTHANNSWDSAKFEVCAHRYVDISEPGFGVAMLNDGRYGHGVQDGGISVSLLRAARFPNPVHDQGRHQVTIGILPHGAGLHDVLRAADALNNPLRVVPAGSAAALATPIVSVDHPGVDVSAVKRADDGSGDLIVRLAEVCGARVQVPVRTVGRITAAHACNLLEEPQKALDVADGFVNLTLRPFELATLRLLE